jgi:hypothetical protein
LDIGALIIKIFIHLSIYLTIIQICGVGTIIPITTTIGDGIIGTIILTSTIGTTIITIIGEIITIGIIGILITISGVSEQILTQIQII